MGDKGKISDIGQVVDWSKHFFTSSVIVAEYRNANLNKYTDVI